LAEINGTTAYRVVLASTTNMWRAGRWDKP
jgi:hypothetical protein